MNYFLIVFFSSFSSSFQAHFPVGKTPLKRARKCDWNDNLNIKRFSFTSTRKFDFHSDLNAINLITAKKYSHSNFSSSLALMRFRFTTFFDLKITFEIPDEI
jgi:hypothetical protein